MKSKRGTEVQRDFFLCFMNNEKSFDRVKHEYVLDTIKKVGVGGKDLKIIQKLY